jgi:hypothetical protein
VNHSNQNEPEQSIVEWRILPTLVESELTVAYPVKSPLEYTIYNSRGQYISSGVLTEIETRIDVNMLARGLYFIGVETDVRKFVKK